MLGWTIDALLAHGHGRLQWWTPRDLSPRISAQQAVFVFGPIVNEAWGSIRLGDGPIDVSEAGNVPGAALVLIRRTLKERLFRTFADVFGYSEETLFPDFDGFARAHAVERDFPEDFPLGGPPPE